MGGLGGHPQGVDRPCHVGNMLFAQAWELFWWRWSSAPCNLLSGFSDLAVWWWIIQVIPKCRAENVCSQIVVEDFHFSSWCVFFTFFHFSSGWISWSCTSYMVCVNQSRSEHKRPKSWIEIDQRWPMCDLKIQLMEELLHPMTWNLSYCWDLIYLNCF